MIIALSWLAKYIDLPGDVAELEKLLTFAGIEVEGVKQLPALPLSVISARIVSAEPVPKSDHLTQCLVDIGEYPYFEKTGDNCVQVICGAPNCHSGMMAVIALPGTELPDITIAKVIIRGVESHGMLCSERELGLSENHAGIIELPEDTPVGITANKLYELPDYIFELEITPNRPDLLGYIGIARDLSAKLNIPLKLPQVALPKAGFPTGQQPLRLINEAQDLCPRYLARMFRKVQIAESPLWMKSALIKSGVRPINNLVDITNYVLMEYGHPLHAFDYDKLASLPEDPDAPAIMVRRAKPGEGFTSLDSKQYSLIGDELVIADGKEASALAGVMGGLDSAISDTTHRIVLESAAFEPTSIRKTSYRHKISTDSSYRYERHLSDHAPAAASERAAQLICELCRAEMGELVLDDWQKPSAYTILGIRPRRYKQLIGYSLTDSVMKDYLEKLGLHFIQYGTWKAGKISDINEVYCHHKAEMEQGITEFSEVPGCVHTLYFAIPPYRVDLEREADLIEELARLDGYDKAPVKTLPQCVMDRHAYRIKKMMADYIVSRGCFETLNYSFTDPALMQKLGYTEAELEPQAIRLCNPQSANQSMMRTSLIPQLLVNAQYNINHGERNIKLFELGRIYLKDGSSTQEPERLVLAITGMDNNEHWQKKPSMVSVSYVKGIFEELLHLLHLGGYQSSAGNIPFLLPALSIAYSYQGKQLGYYGKLKASVAEAFGIDLIDLKQDIWLCEFNVDVIIEITRNVVIEYKPIPRFQAVNRDISFLIYDDIPYSEIENAIRGVDKVSIVEVSVFDEFRGKQVPEGFRSISLHIIFQDQEKTLTDERIDYLVDSVLRILNETWQIKLR